MRQRTFFDDEFEADMAAKRGVAPARKVASNAAEHERDAAMLAVGEAHSDDVNRFMQAAIRVANRGKPFTTDDVLLDDPTLETCCEKRAFGPAMTTLAKRGVIRPLGYAASERKQSHARPKRQWVKAELNYPFTREQASE